jgi:hypothetical protein
MGRLRKLYNEELCNLYSSPVKIRAINSRRMRCVYVIGGKARRKETAGKTNT